MCTNTLCNHKEKPHFGKKNTAGQNDISKNLKHSRNCKFQLSPVSEVPAKQI